MKFKKVAILTLTVCVLATTVLSGCGGSKTKQPVKQESAEKLDPNFNPTGLPVVKEKITLKIAGDRHANNKKEFNDMEVFKKLEQETNIRVEWDITPQTGWVEKRNLAIASGEWPDVILNLGSAGGSSNSEIVRLGSEGVIIPLENLIDKYAPNLKAVFAEKPAYRSTLVAPDSHIYTLPRIAEVQNEVVKDIIFVNKKWMDKLGIQMPKTTDDFRNMLLAFRDKDPNGNGKNDEVPFAFLFKAMNNGLYSLHGSFGQVDYPNHIAVKNNKVIYTAMTNEYKDAIIYFNQLYKDGLMDKEAFTRDLNSLKGLGSGNEQVLGAFSAYSPWTVTTPEREKDYVALEAPLKGPKGHQAVSGYPESSYTIGAMAITKNNKYPEATMRWIDQVFEPIRSLEFCNGPIGTNFKQLSDGRLERVAVPAGMSSGDFRYSQAPANNFPYILQQKVTDKIIAAPSTQSFDRMVWINNVKSSIAYEYYPDILFKEEYVKELAQYNTDIGDYVEKMRAQWITKGGIEQEWDNYLKELKKLNVDRMVKIYQDSYDVVSTKK